MTNSPMDFDKFRNKYGVDYDPVAHGTPPDFGGRTINVPGKGNLPIAMSKQTRHVAGDHATKFNTPADFVRAHDAIIEDPRFTNFANSSADYLRITDFPASRVKDFGANFQSRLKGYDVLGNPTVFGPNTKIIAAFRKDANGVPTLLTMFPDP